MKRRPDTRKPIMLQPDVWQKLMILKYQKKKTNINDVLREML